MKRVIADGRVGAALGDRAGDPGGHVAGDELELLATLLAQQIQEPGHGLLVAPAGRPHQSAGVVVDHDREVSLTLANRDLIDADPTQAGEQVAAVLLLGHHPLADPADRSPRDPHQLGDRGLVRVDGQPRDLILEAAGEARVMPGPRDGGDHHPVLAAAHPWRPRLQVAEGRAQIQRSPAPASLAPVIARAAAPAARAAIPLPCLRTDRHHHRPVVGDLHVFDDRPLQPQQLLPYASPAHAATALSRGSNRCEKPEP